MQLKSFSLFKILKSNQHLRANAKLRFSNTQIVNELATNL